MTKTHTGPSMVVRLGTSTYPKSLFKNVCSKCYDVFDLVYNVFDSLFNAFDSVFNVFDLVFDMFEFEQRVLDRVMLGVR